MNTRERIIGILAANKAEQVKNLLDYKLTLVHKRLEIDAKIANVEAELKKVEAELKQLNPPTEGEI